MVEPELDKNRLVLTNYRIRARLEAMVPLHLRGYSEYEAFFISVAGSPRDRNLFGKFRERALLAYAVLMHTQAQGRRG